MTKECRHCHQVLPLAEFYPHPQMKDGHLNKCRSCVRERVKSHRVAHVERIREYDRTRAKLKHRVQQRTAYAKRYRSENPQKRRAHNLVAYALRTGAIKRQPCEVCRAKRTEAHHDDYFQPLNVRWLCSIHHKQVHHTTT